MKKHYYLLLILPFCFSSFLSAQSKSAQYVTLGVGWNSLVLLTERDHNFVENFSSSRSIGEDRSPISGLGISAGYTNRYHHRWELSFRAQYSGNSVMEDIADLRYHTPFGTNYYQLAQPRTYRSVWFEGLVFWRIFDSYVKPDIQFGTGIVYLFYVHDYLSDFVFNKDIGIYDSRTFTKERKRSSGVPLQLQFQTQVKPDWNIGFNAHLNLFVDGNVTSGITAYTAYSL